MARSSICQSPKQARIGDTWRQNSVKGSERNTAEEGNIKKWNQEIQWKIQWTTRLEWLVAGMLSSDVSSNHHDFFETWEIISRRGSKVGIQRPLDELWWDDKESTLGISRSGIGFFILSEVGYATLDLLGYLGSLVGGRSRLQNCTQQGFTRWSGIMGFGV